MSGAVASSNVTIDIEATQVSCPQCHEPVQLRPNKEFWEQHKLMTGRCCELVFVLNDSHPFYAAVFAADGRDLRWATS